MSGFAARAFDADVILCKLCKAKLWIQALV